MIPQGSSINGQVILLGEQPSRTYRLDIANRRISGMIDDLDAIKQAVYKILLTERFGYLIYSGNYGVDSGPITSDRMYFESQTKRRIKEALTQDQRINDVQGFTFSYNGDHALVQFTVVTQYGRFQSSKEVSG